MANSNPTQVNPCTLKPYATPGDAGVSKVEYIPLNDRILLEPYDVESFSAGGIMVAGDSEAVLHAKVLAVGKGRLMPSGRMTMDVKVGDNVIYGNMANNVEDNLNGKKVLLVVEQCVLAIIKES